MSRTTSEINRVTGTVIGVSLKLILLALVCILMYEGVSRGYSFGHEIFAPTPVEQGNGIKKQVTVEEGMSSMDTAKLLKSYGLIRDTYVFVIEAALYEYEIQPGTYTFTTAQTSMDMLKILNDGPKEGEEMKEGRS